MNGELESINICDGPKMYSYKAEFTADTTQPKSAFLKIELVINYSKTSYYEEHIQDEKDRLEERYSSNKKLRKIEDQ